MRKYFLSLCLLLSSLTGFSKIVIITNWGAHFSPADTSVNKGDTIKFDLVNTHNVVEVDQQAWEAEENTQLAGGFSLPMGGGMLFTAQLTAGIHYYICTPHITLGMKGIITINNPSGISENQFQEGISIFPTPAIDFIIAKGHQLTGATYSIFDVAGKQLLTGRLEREETTIPLNGLPSGLYFFQTEGQRKKSFSVLKQ